MDKETFIKDYQDGMPIKDLKEKYGFSGDGTVYYYLRKWDIPMRGKQKKFDNPFLNNSPERDYWLGWIFSDGCVVNRKNAGYVYLACLDLDILLKFKEFCGDRAKLNKFTYITPVSKETKTMYKVVINSKELVDYFYNTYQISGKKAATLNPNIELNWDLLRGVFDGDGSFKKGVVLTSCSKAWIESVKEFYNQCDLHWTLTKDSAYRLAVYKKTDIQKIYHFLYDSNPICLERKKQDLFRLAEEKSSEK